MRLNKYLVNEATGPTGAQWEEIITLAWNKKITGNDYSNKQLYKDSNITGFKLFKYLPIGEKIVEDMYNKGLPKVIMKHTGSGKAPTSSFWKDITKQSKAVPKTDMILGKHRISLKKEGPSQLMSGLREESEATFLSAVDEKTNIEWLQEIVSKIDNNFIKYKTYDEIDKEEYRNIHKQLTNDINEIFDNDNELKVNFVLEAMSGRHKFGENSWAAATHIMVFTPDGKMKKFKKMDKGLASTLSTGVKLAVRFKSGKGMLPSSSLRADITEGEIIGWINNSVKRILRGLKDSFKKGFTKVMDYLGFDSVDVKVEGDILF